MGARNVRLISPLQALHDCAAVRTAPAIASRTNELTYGDWLDEAETLVAALRDDLVPGDVVVVAAPDYASFLFEQMFVAVISLGCTVAPISDSFGVELGSSVCRSLGAKILVTARTSPVHGAALSNVRVVAESELRESGLRTSTLHREVPSVAPGDCVLCTSGTTGVPRQVRVQYANLYAGMYPATPARRPLLTQFSASAAGGLWGFLTAFHGYPVIRISPLDASGFCSLLERYRPVDVALLPMGIRMLQRKRRVCPAGSAALSVEHVVISGASCSSDDILFVRELFPRAMISNIYTSTEAAPASIVHRTFPDDEIDVSPDRAGLLCLGTPSPNTEVRIADSEFNQCRDGVLGLIWLRAHHDDAYAGGVDASAERGWVCTGDIGSCDAERRIFLAGRADDVVTVGGDKVSMHDIERSLLRLEGVDDAAVISVAHPVWGVQLAAAVERDPTRFNVVAARETLRRRHGASRCPSVILPLDALPRTYTGKVDRQALQRLLDQKALRTPSGSEEATKHSSLTQEGANS